MRRATAGGAVSGFAIGLVERGLRSELSDSTPMLVHAALGVGTGVVLALVLTAIFR